MAKKIHQTQKEYSLRACAIAVASCLALSGIPLVAQAAGLGKIVVFSALGQPLRAEIEVSATRDELVDMKAQLASQEAFKQAGLDYAAPLLGIKFNLEKRSSGQSVIKLSSDRPINDPFLDLLLELNWPAGRLVREYTFLLDPPEVADKARLKQIPVAAKPVARASSISDLSEASGETSKVRSSKAVPKVVEHKAAAQTDVGVSEREVKRGETLHKIASETRYDGVSIDQMLVGLLKANPGAFEGGNVNRLKSGKILSIPEKSVVESVSDVEARKMVKAQSADWNGYRSKLAGVAAQMPAKEESAKQESTGKITAKVEDKVAPVAESKDQLKVSKTESLAAKPVAPASASSKGASEELIAKERALDEANKRLALLEKNVADLQKLIELKNQSLAELQKQASAPSPADTNKQVEAAKSPAGTIAPVTPAAEVATPPAAVQVDAANTEKPVAGAEIPVAAEEAKSVEDTKPADLPKPKSAPAAPLPLPEEPTFVDELFENPLLLAGGGGIVALVVALLVARRRRAGRKESPLDLGSTLSPETSSLSANSVFRSTGGQSVDTASHTPVQTDFSQAGPGSIDTDEVDPVAEADVYMAYGRDAQAEEILLEAKQKDPKRYAIHLKLLEIYSNRQDVKQFETLASDLYGETSGIGAEWEKAAAMGLKLDPANPLFGGVAIAASAPLASIGNDFSESVKDTEALPAAPEFAPISKEDGEIQPAEAAVVESVNSVAEEAIAQTDLNNLDFDLGFDNETSAKGDEESVATADYESVASIEAEPVGDGMALDFDLGWESPNAASSVQTKEETPVVDLDFNLPEVSFDAVETELDEKGAGDLQVAPVVAEVPFPTDQSVDEEVLPVDLEKTAEKPTLADEGDVEFDVSLSESTFLARSQPEAPFDMSSIDLDLETPEFEEGRNVEENKRSTPLAETETALVSPVERSFEDFQVSTAVNPDFAASQSETVVNPDYSVAQAETIVNPMLAEDLMLAPDLDLSSSEEVATKLDLAKAYEEMGDLEGARELLQEVLKEGDAAQQEKANAILVKIGG